MNRDPLNYGTWMAAAALAGLSAAASIPVYDEPGSFKDRSLAKKPKTAASVKRAKAQKAQRIARKRNRK